MGVVTNNCIDTGSRFGTLLWVRYEYIFANSQVFEIGPKKMPTFAEAQAECDALIPDVEAAMILQSQEGAAEAVVGKPAATAAETIIPDFPEELPLSDPDPAVSTRQREFHRYLLRWVWPQDLLIVTQYFVEIWAWIDQMTAPNIRTYLAIDTATFNSVSQRMGDAKTIDDLLDADVPAEIP